MSDKDDKVEKDRQAKKDAQPEVVSELPNKEPGLEPVPLFESFIAPASMYRGVAQKLLSAGGKAVGKKAFAKGGSVSGASKRADGIAQRGKTRGRMV